jgi:ApaG protein
MDKHRFNPALVGISVQTTYLPSHSRPDEDQYTFAYTISISNAGDRPLQLLSRHWLITDANEHVHEVRGEGVVGEQPVIEPGGSYRYTSGATITTQVGFMEGSYQMLVLDGGDERFDAPIPAFTLHTPTALN